jgi:hypothetical protein
MFSWLDRNDATVMACGSNFFRRFVYERRERIQVRFTVAAPF